MSLLCRKAVRSCSCRYGPGPRTKRSARSSKRQREIIAKHCANLREWSDWVERHGRGSREGSGRVERERARYNGATGVSDPPSPRLRRAKHRRLSREVAVERSGKMPRYNATPDDCVHLGIDIVREIHLEVIKQFGG